MNRQVDDPMNEQSLLLPRQIIITIWTREHDNEEEEVYCKAFYEGE